jgi:hypothetical protein
MRLRAVLRFFNGGELTPVLRWSQGETGCQVGGAGCQVLDVQDLVVLNDYAAVDIHCRSRATSFRTVFEAANRTTASTAAMAGTMNIAE